MVYSYISALLWLIPRSY